MSENTAKSNEHQWYQRSYKTILCWRPWLVPLPCLSVQIPYCKKRCYILHEIGVEPLSISCVVSAVWHSANFHCMCDSDRHAMLSCGTFWPLQHSCTSLWANNVQSKTKAHWFSANVTLSPVKAWGSKYKGQKISIIFCKKKKKLDVCNMLMLRFHSDSTCTQC